MEIPLMILVRLVCDRYRWRSPFGHRAELKMHVLNRMSPVQSLKSYPINTSFTLLAITVDK
jgi:hypothetical protein